MKKLFLLMALLLITGVANAATVTKDFTETGAGTNLYVKDGDSITYAVSGTFEGTVVLQKSPDGGLTWETVSSATEAASGTVVAETSNLGGLSFRFLCTDFTSGTIETSISDVTMSPIQEFKNLNGKTVAYTTETGMVVDNLTVSGTLTNSSVHQSGACTALTAGAAVTLTVAAGETCYTDASNDNEDQTITFSGSGSAGDVVTIIFATSSTGDEVITFHATLVSSTGTLTLGTTASRYYTIRFISDGTHWYELSRTAVQT